MRHYLSILFLLLFAASVSFGTDMTQLPKTDDFSISLFTQLQSQPGNLIFSPLSARIAMAMAALGAQGKTARQINDAIGLPIAQPALDMPEIQLANALWVQQGFTLNDGYRNAIREKFGGELNAVDFKSDPNGAGQQINHWVAGKTADKITTLFSDGSLKNSDRLVIVNAIYLKADWAKPFNKDATSDAPFTVNSSDKPVNIPTMHGKIPCRYFANDDLEMISLPYKGDDLSMTILLPRKPDGLSGLEKNLTTTKLDDWMSHEERKEVDLSLPKWKSSTSLDLVSAFQAMGVRTAFTDAADFSGISATTHLKIGGIVQKALIDVDETSTEAAAATGIRMTLSAAFSESLFVKVDHPFLFFLQAHPKGETQQSKPGTILFFGRVTDPRES